jgi:hypothetical protein
VDSTGIYWTAATGLMKCSVGHKSPIALVNRGGKTPAADLRWKLALSETRVYFEDVSHGGRLHSVSKDGGPVEIVDTGGYKVGGGLAAAHGIVYLAGYSNGADHTEVYDVLKIPASGGAAQRIGYGEDGDIVKDGNALYVAERTTGRVVRFAIE